MASAPETHYARAGDVHVAYQLVADRGPDLLFAPTATFPIDLIWDEPAAAHPRSTNWRLWGFRSEAHVGDGTTANWKRLR
jgi:hypothetical protein